MSLTYFCINKLLQSNNYQFCNYKRNSELLCGARSLPSVQGISSMKFWHSFYVTSHCMAYVLITKEQESATPRVADKGIWDVSCI